MKITLIEPAMIKAVDFTEKPSWTLSPLPLAVLAGLTPPDIEVEALDDRLENINYDAPRDLVGISVKTYTAKRAYQIAARFRRRGVPVVMGGWHPTLCPEEAGQHADALVQGEAEGIWEQVLRDAARGQLQPVYRRPPDAPFNFACPNRAIFAGKKYLPVALLETVRGCPNDCSFCVVSKFYGRRMRYRPPEAVAAEAAGLKSQPLFLLADNLTANRPAAQALFQALTPLRAHWVSELSLTVARDPALVRLMRASGCSGVLVGIETLDNANLRQINKSWNTVGVNISSAIQVLRDNDIPVVGSFLMGMDGDTPAALDQLLEFAQRQRLFAVLFNILMPNPGTDLYADWLKQGRLTKPEWWIDPTYRYGDVVFKPNGLAAAELEMARLSMYRTFYGPRSILVRLGDRTNCRDLWRCLTFLGLNLPAYREEARRFRKPLGAAEDYLDADSRS